MPSGVSRVDADAYPDADGSPRRHAHADSHRCRFTSSAITASPTPAWALPTVSTAAAVASTTRAAATVTEAAGAAATTPSWAVPTVPAAAAGGDHADANANANSLGDAARDHPDARSQGGSAPATVGTTDLHVSGRGLSRGQLQHDGAQERIRLLDLPG